MIKKLGRLQLSSLLPAMAEPNGTITLQASPSLLSNSLAVRSDGAAFAYAHRSTVCVCMNSAVSPPEAQKLVGDQIATATRPQPDPCSTPHAAAHPHGTLHSACHSRAVFLSSQARRPVPLLAGPVLCARCRSASLPGNK